MKLSRIALIAVPVALAIGFIAHRNHGPCGSRGPGCGCGDGPRGVAFQKLKALRSDLDLSFGQKIKIHSVVKGYKDSLKSQWAAGKAARGSLKEAITAHGTESPEVQTAATALAEASRGRALLFAKIAGDIRPILSEEQARKFETARQEFEALIQSKLDSLS